MRAPTAQVGAAGAEVEQFGTARLEYTSRGAMTPADYEALGASWITPEIAEAAGIRRVESSEGASLVGRNGSGDYAGLAFPYRLPGEDRAREFRLRLDTPPMEQRPDGSVREKFKYLSPPGRANLLYFPPGTTTEQVADVELPVAITEGEKKTLALARLATHETTRPRWLAVGLCGVWSWRGVIGKTAGPSGDRRDVKGVIPDIERIAWQGRKVYVVFDNDAAANPSVAAARRALSRELMQRGAEVFVVELPAGPLKGVDDLLGARGPEAVLPLFAQAAEGPALLAYPATEAGAAERLIDLHGRDMRYVSEWKSWIVWDGLRWRRDLDGAVERLTIDSLRAAMRQAVDLPKDDRAAVEGHLRRMESARAVHAILDLARIQEGVTIQVEDLDRNRFLLGVSNGVLDLERGALLDEPRREDLITKSAGVAFDPAATCPNWLRFLSRAMGVTRGAGAGEIEDAKRRMRFLQKAVGLSLSGDVSEKVTFCLFGDTNTGKTTFLEAVRAILADGEYSHQIKIQSLLANGRQSDSNAQSDLCDLRGCRFVTTSEAEKGQQLSEAILKYLTQGGQTRIKAARKYENHISFPATHKLWLDSNDKPRIRAMDDSVWNRLKPLGFEVRIPDSEIDTSFPAKLQAEAPGILRWALEGFRLWRAEGLGDPPDVEAARQSWKDECDPLTDFIDESCELDPDGWAAAKDLRAAYERWCDDNGQKNPVGPKVFAARLEARGCTGDNPRVEGKRTRIWRGISLV